MVMLPSFGDQLVRLTTAFNRILRLSGATVQPAAFTEQGLVIALRRSRLDRLPHACQPRVHGAGLLDSVRISLRFRVGGERTVNAGDAGGAAPCVCRSDIGTVGIGLHTSRTVCGPRGSRRNPHRMRPAHHASTHASKSPRSANSSTSR